MKKNRKGKIGFTCSSFDLCHAGHYLMLKECKEQCDYLIIGLQSDPTLDRPHKNKPVMSFEERKIIMEGIKYVDEVIPYDTEADLVELLKELAPDVRIIGMDWKGKKFTGHDLPIKVYYNSRNHSWSTTDLRDRIFRAEQQKRAKVKVTEKAQVKSKL